jgi:hypothetical protein
MQRKHINCFILKDKENKYFISSTKKIPNTIHITFKYACQNGLIFKGNEYVKLFNMKWKKILIDGFINLYLPKNDYLIMYYFYNNILKSKDPEGFKEMDRNSILTPMKLSGTSEIPKNNNENKKINNMKDFNKKYEKYFKS